MRKINKIFIHYSETKAGKHVTIDDINTWHRQRGFTKIGYHFVIYLDGSVHKGRDISEIGAHCEGNNTTSIGICYIGGLDTNGKSKDTRTDVQKSSLVKLVAELKKQFPDATIHGHNEFSNKDCPGFDVKKEFPR